MGHVSRVFTPRGDLSFYQYANFCIPVFKMHTVLETKLACIYSLKRLIEIEKTFQIN